MSHPCRQVWALADSFASPMIVAESGGWEPRPLYWGVLTDNTESARCLGFVQGSLLDVEGMFRIFKKGFVCF